MFDLDSATAVAFVNLRAVRSDRNNTHRDLEEPGSRQEGRQAVVAAPHKFARYVAIAFDAFVSHQEIGKTWFKPGKEDVPHIAFSKAAAVSGSVCSGKHGIGNRQPVIKVRHCRSI